MEYPGRYVSVTTNSLGLRNKEISVKKPAGVIRILILGDSYTFGVYVDNNSTYPSVLERSLSGDGYKVQVINAGYADGFEADEQFVWLVNRGLEFEPDIIVYGFFVGNDIDVKPETWRGLDAAGLPKTIHSNTLYVDEWGRLRSRNADNKTVGQEFIYKIPMLREMHFFVALGLKAEML